MNTWVDARNVASANKCESLCNDNEVRGKELEDFDGVVMGINGMMRSDSDGRAARHALN
jgi:hypothetical protein